MNLINCTTSENRRLIVEGGECILEIPESLSSKVANLGRGSKLKLGVRPEDIEIQDKPKGLSCQAEVYLLESLGDSTIVDYKIGDLLLRVKTAARHKAKIGEKAYLHFNETRIFLFDGLSERAL